MSHVVRKCLWVPLTKNPTCGKRPRRPSAATKEKKPKKAPAQKRQKKQNTNPPKRPRVAKSPSTKSKARTPKAGTKPSTSPRVVRKKRGKTFLFLRDDSGIVKRELCGPVPCEALPLRWTTATIPSAFNLGAYAGGTDDRTFGYHLMFRPPSAVRPGESIVPDLTNVDGFMAAFPEASDLIDKFVIHERSGFEATFGCSGAGQRSTTQPSMRLSTWQTCASALASMQWDFRTAVPWTVIKCISTRIKDETQASNTCHLHTAAISVGGPTVIGLQHVKTMRQFHLQTTTTTPQIVHFAFVQKSPLERDFAPGTKLTTRTKDRVCIQDIMAFRARGIQVEVTEEWAGDSFDAALAAKMRGEPRRFVRLRVVDLVAMLFSGQSPTNFMERFISPDFITRSIIGEVVTILQCAAWQTIRVANDEVRTNEDRSSWPVHIEFTPAAPTVPVTH